MKQRTKRWILGSALGVTLLCACSIVWLVASEGGARWILARASTLLPEELEIGSVDGTLLRGLSFSSITWDDDSAQVTINSIRTHFELMPLLAKDLNVTVLEVQGVAISLREQADKEAQDGPFSVDLPISVAIDSASIRKIGIKTGDAEYLLDEVFLRGALVGPDLEVAMLNIRSELAELSMSANARLSQPYEADASIDWTLTLPEQRPLAGHLQLAGDAKSYEIQHGLEAPYQIETAGRVSFSQDEFLADLSSTWDSIGFSTGDGREVSVRDGALRVAGSPTTFSFEASANILAAGVPELNVELQGQGDSRTLSIASALVSSDHGVLSATGEVVVSPEAGWNLDYEFSDIDPALAYSELNGKLKLRGHSSGAIVNGQVTADATVDDLSGNLNGYPVAGAGRFNYAANSFEFNETRLIVGDNIAVLNGAYGELLRLEANLELSNLSQLLPDAAGTLAGSIDFRSGAKGIALMADLQGSSLGWKSYAAERLDARYDLPAVGNGQIMVQLGNVRINETSFRSIDANVLGSIDSHSLQVSIDSGPAQVNLHADGRWANEQWSATFDELSAVGDLLGEWRLQEAFNLRASGAVFDMGRACLAAVAQAGSACIELDNADAGPLRFNASISGLPVAALPIYLPDGSKIDGTVEGRVDGTLADQRLTADANVSVNDLGVRALHEGDEVSIDFAIASINASIIENKFVGTIALRSRDNSVQASADITLGDIFSMESDVLGNASVELTDLELVSFLYPDVTKTSGRIDGRVEVSGSLTAPEFVGEIALGEGAFEFRRAGIAISEIELRLRQSDTGRLSLDGSARSGEGQLSVEGVTELSSAGGIRTEVAVKGDDFLLTRLPEWRVTASPDIVLVLDDRVARVTGELGIPNADVAIHEVPESAQQPSPDVAVHRTDAEEAAKRREIFVDVRTTLGDSVALAAFGLTTGLEGTVRIVGGSKSPYTGSGRLTLREGQYKAYGQNLQIEQGELIFNGPLDNPSLDIRATRTANDDVVAGIHLTGTPKQLRSEVYSEPPLGDAEALSYLLTGRSLVNASTEQGNMLDQAAFALGLTTAGAVASRIRGDLGLDTLGVRGGSGQQQFVAGKRLGTRLLVEYAYGIVDNLGTLLLRYQLNSRLVVESRSGTVSNVDIVYSVKKE